MLFFLFFLIILLLIILSLNDIKKRIISNKIIILLLSCIIPFSLLKYNELFIVSAFIFLLLGFIVFQLGIIGGGDIKLITVLMLSVPVEQLISFFFFTSIAGLFLIIIGWLFFRDSIKKKGLPYGVAISLGFLMNLSLFA
ncbi:prepilin peptidase [Pasteurella canis]|nr:prepilin peptidase [Pasteurella canis]